MWIIIGIEGKPRARISIFVLHSGVTLQVPFCSFDCFVNATIAYIIDTVWTIRELDIMIMMVQIVHLSEEARGLGDIRRFDRPKIITNFLLVAVYGYWVVVGSVAGF